MSSSKSLKIKITEHYNIDKKVKYFMSGYSFIASSKELKLPEEIEAYNHAGIFNDVDKCFDIWDLTEQDEGEREALEKIFTMPYIYYVAGVGNSDFWLYIEKYIEVGDVLELVNIVQQDKAEQLVQGMLANPETIHINVGSLTYQDKYGTYQLQNKNWIEDLNHRTILSNFGVTTIVKY